MPRARAGAGASGPIVVSGAAGKTGRAAVRALVRRGATVRAFVRLPSQEVELLALGAAETVAGDMRDGDVWGAALRDAAALYHICPNMAPDEIGISHLAMGAVRDAGVSPFVYHSVLHPGTKTMPHHWAKLRVEEALFESDLQWTVLQPAAYMQNILAGWNAVAEDGIYRVPYSSGTKLGMVDLEDVAEVAALVLTERGHAGAIYELCGSEVLTQDETAAIIGAALGRSVRVETIPLHTWEENARDVGLGDYAVHTLLAMFRYYERHGFWGNPNVLTWLLGRPSTTFTAFVDRTIRTL